MSNFEITLSSSIFQLERLSKDAHGYLVGIFNFRYCFRNKSLSRLQNGSHFENFEMLYTALIDLSYEKIMPLCQKSIFHGDDVTEWPESCLLYSCLGEVRSESKLQDNVSLTHANIVIVFRSYTCLKKISTNSTFSRSQVKGQRHRLTVWHWHLNGHNSVNLGIIKVKQQLKCKK